MLYALRFPLSFGVLAVAFVIGLYLRSAAARLVSRQRRPAWARNLTRRRATDWLKPTLDPYGCVAAVLGGPAWGRSVEIGNFVRRPPSRVVAQLLAGPITLLLIGIAALVGFSQWSGVDLSAAGWLREAYQGAPHLVVPGSHVRYELNFGQVALLLAGIEWLTMGVLAIMPLPPLDGGRLLFAVVPRTPGWQRAHYRLDEENWGTLILLVLALPIFGTPLLVTLLGKIVDPLVRLVS